MLERLPLPLLAAPMRVAEPDPRVLSYTLPEQVPQGPVSASGNQRAVLAGDAAASTCYAVTVTWLPGHMFRPHRHANDRFITALSGTSIPAGTP